MIGFKKKEKKTIVKQPTEAYYYFINIYKNTETQKQFRTEHEQQIKSKFPQNTVHLHK